MYKWIAGSTCAAAVLSLAVAPAQTYPQTSDSRPATKSAPTTQHLTLTGCVMPGGDSRTTSASHSATSASGWILSNATASNDSASNITTAGPHTSRSGSPSNEGTSAANRNGTNGIGVSGSTSATLGTSGTTSNATPSIDSEAHGGGTVGATDQAGSTVGAGATASATGSRAAGIYRQPRDAYRDEPVSGTSGTSSSRASSYQLTGITNPNEYAGKRVEITGMLVNARVTARSERNRATTSSGNPTPMLRVTSVRVLGGNCQ